MCENNNLISPHNLEIPTFVPRLRLGVLASGKGSNLKALIRLTKSELEADIKCLIVNNAQAGAIDIAKKNNIDCSILNHNNYKSREELDEDIINIFLKYNIEIIVMAGWMRIVTPVLINKFKNRIINIHPSLLPSFKGANAVSKTLEHKVKITGCTAHIVEEEIDSGEILIQAALRVNENDNEQSLLKRIQLIEHQILYKGIAIAGSRLRINY